MQEPIARLCALKPVMASRVCEAALRACTPEAVLAGCPSKNLVQFTAGLNVAAKACSPANHPRTAQLFTDTKLATRMCSLLVSCAKQLRLALVPDYLGVTLLELPYLIEVANLVAVAGDLVWTRAILELEAAPSAGQHASARRAGSTQRQQQITQQLLAAPGLATWLAATGKGLFAVGQLLSLILAWHIAFIEQHSSAAQAAHADSHMVGHLLGVLYLVTSHASALQWLHTVLTALLAGHQQSQSGGAGGGSTAAAAAPAARNRRHPVSAASSASAATSAQSVQPAVLQELLQQLSAHQQRYQPLLDECSSAAASRSLPHAASALKAFAHAAAGESGEEPDLADSLALIGGALISAFPAKFGCNMPNCTNLDGLTEAAGNRVCGGCKVGDGCSGGLQSQQCSPNVLSTAL